MEDAMNTHSIFDARAEDEHHQDPPRHYKEEDVLMEEQLMNVKDEVVKETPWGELPAQR